MYRFDHEQPSAKYSVSFSSSHVGFGAQRRVGASVRKAAKGVAVMLQNELRGGGGELCLPTTMGNSTPYEI